MLLVKVLVTYRLQG